MVFTRLAAVKKKYTLPTKANKKDRDNSNNNVSYSNVVSTEKPTFLTRVVPETQTQVVEATQGVNVPSTTFVASQDDVSSISDKGYMATEPKKTSGKGTDPKEKSSSETAITTPTSPKKVDVNSEIVLPSIKILKYGYATPEKKNFRTSGRTRDLSNSSSSHP